MRKGSALIGVLAFALPITIVIASLARWQITETRINHKHVLRQESKNAVDALIEYGFAELQHRFEQQASFATNELAQDKNPLTLPSSHTAFYQNTSIDINSLEIRGGTVPPGTWKYVAKDDLAYDPLIRGQWVYLRDIKVYAKATASQGNTAVSSFLEHTIQVTDAPLFSHAVFYNHDIEFFPYPNMFMNGPVHANGNMYLRPSNKLEFSGPVTLTGDFLLRKKEINNNGHYKEYTGNKVKINNKVAKVDGVMLDSRHTDWRDESLNHFNEGILDRAHDVPTLNPVGIEDYVPDDPTTAANELINSGYALIEPVLPAFFSDGSPNPDFKGAAVRAEKFAYKAGLILRVEYNTAWNPSDPVNQQFVMNAYKYTRSSVSDPLSEPTLDIFGNPSLVSITLPSGIVGNATSTGDAVEVGGDRYPELYNDSGTGAVDGGLYDPRENKGYSLFTLDIAQLRTELHNNNISSFDNNYDWNGIVYVEFPTSNAPDGSGVYAKGNSGGRADNIVVVDPVYQDFALQVINADEVPNPTGAVEEGFTLASNAPVFTVGHINADGALTADSNFAKDSSDEVPVLIAGDAVTPLSPNWPNTRHNSNNDRDSREARDLEISAALISGTNATDSTDNQTESGGVQNYIRKFETWKYSGDANFPFTGPKTTYTVAYRGSIVSIFEPEVKKAEWRSGYARPPIRNFGYSDIFSQERRYPPGTPNVRLFIRGNYNALNENDYNTAVAALP